MNRRDFLKKIGLGAGAVVASHPIVKALNNGGNKHGYWIGKWRLDGSEESLVQDFCPKTEQECFDGYIEAIRDEGPIEHLKRLQKVKENHAATKTKAFS